MKERVRQVRIALDMSQAEFAKKIGVAQTTIAALENGPREVLDRHIKMICSAFKVNEKWLRYGEGVMFSNKSDDIINKLADELNLGELSVRALRAYASLSEQDRAVFERFFFDVCATESESTQAPKTKQQKLDDYGRELDLQEDIRISSASRTIKEAK